MFESRRLRIKDSQIRQREREKHHIDIVDFQQFFSVDFFFNRERERNIDSRETNSRSSLVVYARDFVQLVYIERKKSKMGQLCCPRGPLFEEDPMTQLSEDNSFKVRILSRSLEKQSIF